MFLKNVIRAVVCAAVVLVLGSCLEPLDDNAGTVIINMEAIRGAQRQADNENDIKYKITFSGKSGRIELKAEGGTIIKTTLAAGIWKIDVEASLNGKLYTGSDVVEVKAGQTVHKDDIILKYTCVHHWDEVERTPATCSAKGMIKYTCLLDANHTKTVEIDIDPNAHNFINPAITPATCEEPGEEKGTCTICNQLTTKTLPALGHNYDNWTKVTAPTCTEPGEETGTCTRGDGATDTRPIPIDPDAHDWGDWEITKAATPTTDGVETQICNHNASHHGVTRAIPKKFYIITGSGTAFTATRGDAAVGMEGQAIQSVIDAIRTDADGEAAIQFGDLTDTLNIGTASASFNGAWSAVTLTGKITGSNPSTTSGTIVTADSVSVTSTADIANTNTNSNGMAVYHNSTGAVTISGGTVQAITGNAVYSNSTGKITVSGTALVTSASGGYGSSSTIRLEGNGTATDVRLEITGGTVENTSGNSSSYAVGNGTSGMVTISGGTISVTSGYAVSNSTTGTVTISGGTISATSGRAIHNQSQSTGAVTISGGTISATTGVAVYNYSTGTITISGGTVSAITGQAVYNASTGKITVSGTAKVTSANTGGAQGTIYISSGGTATDVRLEITGGTVENTANNGNAVYNASPGAVTISGGEVKATTGLAVCNINAGKVTVSGTAKVTANTTAASGTIGIGSSGNATAARLEITGGTVENTADNGNAVHNQSTGAVIISGGTVSATTGRAVSSNSTGSVTISGGTVQATTGTAVYTESHGKITVSGTALVTSANTNDSQGTIYTVNHTGDNTDLRLEITGGTIQNTSATTGNAVYHRSIGAVTMSGGSVLATGTSVRAIYNWNTGAVTISGGMISATGASGYSIYNNSTGAVTVDPAATIDGAQYP
jgi:hypothetical protein